MRVSTALDAFWISRIGQPGYSLIPRYKPLGEFDSQSNSQIFIVIIKTFCRFGHIVDTSVICSLHQWCSQPQERWWRGIKWWVSSIFHQDAPTHTYLTLILLHFTWIWTYSILDYCHHHISYLTHITTILHFISDPQSILIPSWQIFLQQVPAAALCCSTLQLVHCSAVPSQCQHQALASDWSSSDSGLWLVTYNDELKTTFYHLLRIVVWNLEEKDSCSGNEGLSYFLTHWHLISC